VRSVVAPLYEWGCLVVYEDCSSASRQKNGGVSGPNNILHTKAMQLGDTESKNHYLKPCFESKKRGRERAARAGCWGGAALPEVGRGSW
jgi:hypothetical protein